MHGPGNIKFDFLVWEDITYILNEVYQFYALSNNSSQVLTLVQYCVYWLK
jgi:hypothetical protein